MAGETKQEIRAEPGEQKVLRPREKDKWKSLEKTVSFLLDLPEQEQLLGVLGRNGA